MPELIDRLRHPVGVAHGRFQVLHNDHLKYLLAAKGRCEHLVVGITNPDPSQTRNHAADPMRSTAAANPLTYYERYRLVRAALAEAGVPEAQFSVVPLPINLPERYLDYVPSDAVYFLTIYDDWGRQKREFFCTLGLAVDVLWEVDPSRKGISGTEVRRRMAAAEAWHHLVPPVVGEMLELWGVPERVRTLFSSSGEARQK